MKSNLFESILHNTDIIDRIGEAFGQLVDAIKSLVEYPLHESTKSGSTAYQRVLNAASKVKSLLDELNFMIDNDELVVQNDASGWAALITEGETPSVLLMQKLILDDRHSSKFDDEDRLAVVKGTQIYGQLVSMYRSAIHRYNLKNPKVKIESPQEVDLKKTKFSIDEESIIAEIDSVKSTWKPH